MTSDQGSDLQGDAATLFGRCGLLPTTRMALAVSGGSDSVALMVLFADWLRHQGKGAGLHTVLTVDHGLRPDSASEARAAAAQAQSLGFKHAILVWGGVKPTTGIQAAARGARYRLLAGHMIANGISLLLTGHTRDDQAETILMRLARGSGIDGLAGMGPRLWFGDLGLRDPAAVDLEVVRPLLDVPRARLRALLQERGVAWIDDPSNLSPEFERPRLRAARAQLDALGLTDSMLTLSAGRLLRARRALDQAVLEFCRPDAGRVSVDPCGVIAIDRVGLEAAEEEIALRVLARAIAAAGGSDEPVSLARLEAIVALMLGGGTETPKRTLARAMITATGPTITIEREPGREQLPLLKLVHGLPACWDGRFRVRADVAGGAIEVRPLGAVAARELRQQGAVSTRTPRVPTRALAMLPSFWREDCLVAVPPLDFWSNPDWRSSLQAHFMWEESLPRQRLGSWPKA